MNRPIAPCLLAAGLILGLPSGAKHNSAAATTADAAERSGSTPAKAAAPEQMARGARVYRSLCLACHLPDGRGFPGVCPPLAEADYLLADRARAIRIVLRGLKGPIVVNGETYNGDMPPLADVLSDQQVADVLTYAFNSWGNTGPAFHERDVAAVRARTR
jgi:nitrite reductase (NO-forming)